MSNETHQNRPFLETAVSGTSNKKQTLTKLCDLKPGIYVNTIVIIRTVKAKTRKDNLGTRQYLFGISEDSSHITPFISYIQCETFFRNAVYNFENASVHQFEDKSLILILNERSKIQYLPEENPQNYNWQPKIREIQRPLGRCNITLEGIVSKIYASSGLIKRCEKCNRIMFDHSCIQCGETKWYWSLRISCKLNDDSGGISTVFPQYISSRILGKPISELMCLANIPEKTACENPEVQCFKIQPPQEIFINEYTVEDPLIFKHSNKLIVEERHRSKIISPENVSVRSKHIIDQTERRLNLDDEYDRTIWTCIIEKALDITIRKNTGLPKMHGIYLTEEPVDLYWTERAKLYLGFELEVKTELDHVRVCFYPNTLIRESVLDYINWRRKRGASATSVKRTLLKDKKNVILAPNGTIGLIEEFLCQKAGDFVVPVLNVSLIDFWKETYGIEVDPSELPLLVIKPYNLDVKLPIRLRVFPLTNNPCI